MELQRPGAGINIALCHHAHGHAAEQACTRVSHWGASHPLLDASLNELTAARGRIRVQN